VQIEGKRLEMGGISLEDSLGMRIALEEEAWKAEKGRKCEE